MAKTLENCSTSFHPYELTLLPYLQVVGAEVTLHSYWYEYDHLWNASEQLAQGLCYHDDHMFC